MPLKEKLSSSQIKYLLALKTLCEENGKARSLDVAVSLGLAKPSVHKMLDTLKEMGLVNKKHYGEISLTEKGAEIADEYEECFLLLSESIKLPPFDKSERENALRAFLSELSFLSLETILEKSRT